MLKNLTGRRQPPPRHFPGVSGTEYADGGIVCGLLCPVGSTKANWSADTQLIDAPRAYDGLHGQPHIFRSTAEFFCGYGYGCPTSALNAACSSLFLHAPPPHILPVHLGQFSTLQPSSRLVTSPSSQYLPPSLVSCSQFIWGRCTPLVHWSQFVGMHTCKCKRPIVIPSLGFPFPSLFFWTQLVGMGSPFQISGFCPGRLSYFCTQLICLLVSTFREAFSYSIRVGGNERLTPTGYHTVGLIFNAPPPGCPWAFTGFPTCLWRNKHPIFHGGRFSSKPTCSLDQCSIFLALCSTPRRCCNPKGTGKSKKAILFGPCTIIPPPVCPNAFHPFSFFCWQSQSQPTMSGLFVLCPSQVLAPHHITFGFVGLVGMLDSSPIPPYGWNLLSLVSLSLGSLSLFFFLPCSWHLEPGLWFFLSSGNDFFCWGGSTVGPSWPFVHHQPALVHPVAGQPLSLKSNLFFGQPWFFLGGLPIHMGQVVSFFCWVHLFIHPPKSQCCLPIHPVSSCSAWWLAA